MAKPRRMFGCSQLQCSVWGFGGRVQHSYGLVTPWAECFVDQEGWEGLRSEWGGSCLEGGALGHVLPVSPPNSHWKIPIALFCCYCYCFYSKINVFKDSDFCPMVMWEGLPQGRKVRSGLQWHGWGASGPPSVTQISHTVDDCHDGGGGSGLEKAEVKSQPYRFFKVQSLQCKAPYLLGPPLSHL